MVKLSSNKKWVKGSEFKNGDIVKLVSEGGWEESSKFTYNDGSPVQQFIIKIEVNGEEKDMTLNKASRNNLTMTWGYETSEWVGKSAKVEKVKVMVGGDLKDCVVLHPTGQVQQASQPDEDFSTAGDEEAPF